LGIDLGTSCVKVILINDQQHIVASHSVPLTVSRPHPLWSEQNPEDWWHATQSAMLKLKQTHAKELMQLRAIGFSGQMHGATLLDKQGRVLRPAILWNDGRAMTQCQTLLQREPQAIEITGNLIMPGFTAPKVLWVKDNELNIFNQIDKVLLPKDYLRYKISGDYATDLSDASGTSWLNVSQRCWSDAMLAATELAQHHMPTLFEGNQITGTVTKTIAQHWGIPDDVVLVAGGGDNAASAISMNVTQPGSAFLSLGTSGVFFVADQQYRPNPQQAVHTFCHCLPGLWHEMTVHLSAAASLDWLAHILNNQNIADLIQQAQQHESADTPIFLPYLSGERTPHNDPYARGVFFGMTHNTQAPHLVQAVLEGVAFAIAQGQQMMQSAGVTIDEVSVVGGGARSRYWGEILSAALQRPLVYRQASNVGGAYGAARLAWLAIHDTVDPLKAFASPPIDYIIEPDPQRVDQYVNKQPLFNELYQQLKGTFAKW